MTGSSIIFRNFRRTFVQVGRENSTFLFKFKWNYEKYWLGARILKYPTYIITLHPLPPQHLRILLLDRVTRVNATK